MTPARAALAAAAARFGFSATPRLDAELLLAHALGIDRAALLLDPDRPVPPAFAQLVERRAGGEPVAYLTGTRGFWAHDFSVGPGALVPRADSETLIAAALDMFKRPPDSVLDLGTGPGTLLLTLLGEWPAARGLGVDRSAAALAWARINRDALGLATRAQLVRGDWAMGVAGRWRCIVANPPYVAIDDSLPGEVRDHEPAAALFAGVDGLDAYRAIVPALDGLLADEGAVLLEIGATQAEAVSALLRGHGFAAAVRLDLGGRARCVIATRS